MGILTPDQDLLGDYLFAAGCSLARWMYIMGILWDHEATVEMLQYIADTGETDREKLYSVACEIAQKYKREDEEDWLINDEDDLE